MGGCPSAVQTTCESGHKEVSFHIPFKRLDGSDPYGLIVSGSSADPIVGHFAVTYHNEAEALGIDLNDLYSALLADGNNTPPNWDIEGRQADAYM